MSALEWLVVFNVAMLLVNIVVLVVLSLKD